MKHFTGERYFLSNRLRLRSVCDRLDHNKRAALCGTGENMVICLVYPERKGFGIGHQGGLDEDM
eukprot:7148355-Pyramimonas_sp.AAC.1